MDKSGSKALKPAGDRKGTLISHYPPCTVVLVGFMGCGKSSLARALASRLHIPATDLDHLLEAREGTTIAQIFATCGEEAFRKLETEVLRDALSNLHTPMIIATGGGIVTREANRALLKQASEEGVLVVYIKAAPEVLAQRIRRQPGLRPLIDGERILNIEETRARVEEILAVRSPLYEEVANIVVESGAASVGEIADEIIAQFQNVIG
jgi:shikimate kinase